MSNGCPGCERRDAEKAVMAASIRELADTFAGGAGARIGGAIAGPRGAIYGSEIAPRIIEEGSLAIAKAVKRKRRQSRNQKRNAVVFLELKDCRPCPVEKIHQVKSKSAAA